MSALFSVVIFCCGAYYGNLCPVIPGKICELQSSSFCKILFFFAGRASATPSIDLFITLMSLGVSGFRKLLSERKSMYLYLKERVDHLAECFGERLLQTSQNPISMGKICRELSSSMTCICNGFAISCDFSMVLSI